MEQQTFIIRNFLRITDPDIHFRRMAYPPERVSPMRIISDSCFNPQGKLSATTPEELGKMSLPS